MSGSNEQRNSYVRKQITEALLRLLRQKKLREISVSELTEKAGVGRVSFYRNYSDLESVLKQESDRLIGESETLKHQEGDPSYFVFFDFLKEHADFYTTVYKAGFGDIIRDSLLKSAAIDDDTPQLEAYMKSFWAYGLYGWISEWIRRGMKESSEEIFALFLQSQQKQ